MKNLFLILFILSFNFAKAQELNFEVNINTPKLQTADPKVFEDLEVAIEEFLNGSKWTDVEYQPHEKIKGNLQLNIKNENSTTEFTADLQIQAVRPIYGSSAESVLISHGDKDITFTYEQQQPIVYAENSFQDNLSSVLSYYVYLILGIDGDTFAPFGGEDYFQKAKDISTTVPQNLLGLYNGWNATSSNRNRYWLIENYLNPRLRPYREGMYQYHINGIDQMHTDAETAKIIMADVIERMVAVEKSYPNAIALQVFTNSKGGEIVDIFKIADSNTKAKVKRAMTKIDASNAALYRSIGR